MILCKQKKKKKKQIEVIERLITYDKDLLISILKWSIIPVKSKYKFIIIDKISLLKVFLFSPISRCLIHPPRSIQTRLKHFYEQTSVITAENL